MTVTTAPTPGAQTRSEPSAALPLGAIVAAVLLGAIAFTPGVRDMWGRWMAEDSYYAHGPIVPLVSAWLIWRQKERLRAIPVGSSPLGIVLAIGCTLVLAFSLVEDIHFTQNFALVGMVVAAALVFLGTGVVRAIAFPLAFLTLMVPLPQMVIANLTFTLKMFAASLAVMAIRFAGFTVVREGSTMHLASTSVTVDDVCSGLRTLISLVALGVLFAYFERSRWKAALTIALSVPIAIVANVVRILVLCIFAAYDHPAAHGGPMHEATGLAVFAVALVLLMAIRSIPDGAAEAEDAGVGPPAGASAPPRRGPVVALLAMLVFGAATSVAFGFSAVSVEKTERTRAIPATIGGWVGRDVPFAKRVFELLETEDIVIRRYASAAIPGYVDLYVVHAADSRKVAHPPEICFSGGGFTAREKGEAALDSRGAHIPAVRMHLDHGRSSLLVYYWYRLEGRDTASYLDHQFDHLLRRLRQERRDGTMIRLSTPVLGEDIAAAEARIAAFARDALPAALEALR